MNNYNPDSTTKYTIPRIYYENHSWKSDRCVWCGKTDGLTHSHLIPDSLGGWFAPEISCNFCNNALGTLYENAALRNVFFAAAVVKHKIKQQRDAYRQAAKWDADTGSPMYIDKDGIGKAVPGKLGNTHFRGGTKHTVRFYKKWFERNRPDVPFEPMKEFLCDPKRTKFEYAGEVFRSDRRGGGKNKLRISLERDPNHKMIFKILYEYICLNGLLEIGVLYNFFRGFIKVNDNDQANRIIISDDIYKYVFSNTQTIEKIHGNLEEVPFRDFHYFTMHITENGVLYFEVMLFGAISNIFIVGEWPIEDETFYDIYDRCMIFPIFDKSIAAEMYPHISNENWKMHYMWCNINVEHRMDQINRLERNPGNA